jgi:hypothetical protein
MKSSVFSSDRGFVGGWLFGWAGLVPMDGIGNDNVNACVVLSGMGLYVGADVAGMDVGGDIFV